jgi:PAS domain S-box-containing protein
MQITTISRIKINKHLPLCGALMGFLLWSADVGLDYLLFSGSRSLGEMMVYRRAEFYFLLAVGASFVLLGYYLGYLFKKQAELKAEIELKAGMLDLTTDSVMIHDPEGHFIYLNEAACSLRGYTRQEMMKLSLPLINAPETRPNISEHVEEISRRGGKSFEAVNIKKDGSLIALEVHAQGVKIDGREAVLSIAHDISLRKEHEQARDSLLKELQTALSRIRTLSGLIPICSHCKKIRNDQGFWQQVEVYIKENTEADFSYGLCDNCSRELYPEFSQPDQK